MSYIFSKSARGYSHLRNGKPCQDFSSSYKDKERCIITCCDGHGGDAYIRSDRGSKFASRAIMNVFMSISKKQLANADEEFLKGIKLSILCSWNSMVENDYGFNPIRKSSIKDLTEDQVFGLKMNPVKAYGTTMAGVLELGDYYLIASIGDTEVLGVKKGELVKIFDDEDEPVANITYSMCQEDAFDHIKVKVIESREVDGIVLCTDGLSSPYQSYDNFQNSFIKPLFYSVGKELTEIKTEILIDEIAYSLGIGDDVSLAYIVKKHFARSYYETC